MGSRIQAPRRLVHYYLSRRRSFSSSAYANPSSKEPIMAASASLLKDQSPPPHLGSASKQNKLWSFLKFGLFAAFTGATATAGYATYAYTLEEVDEKTKLLRKAASSYKVEDNASILEKFQAMLYSAAITVPAKSTELYLDLRRSIEEQIQAYNEPWPPVLLPDLHPQEQHAFTLVLDLHETLTYSDWTRERGWRTCKRPGVDAFLEHLSQFYEIVVYSDQQPMSVDPIIDRLNENIGKICIRYKLSRPATRYQDGKHYRDLSKLNRDPAKILYISGNAYESTLQPENAVPIMPWKVDIEDTTLIDLIPFLEYVARNSPADIRPVLASYQGHHIPTEFNERRKEYLRLMQQEKKAKKIIPWL